MSLSVKPNSYNRKKGEGLVEERSKHYGLLLFLLLGLLKSISHPIGQAEEWLDRMPQLFQRVRYSHAVAILLSL